jgi:hypothetical protein
MIMAVKNKYMMMMMIVFGLVLCIVVALFTTTTAYYEGITVKNPVMTIVTEPVDSAASVSAVEPAVVQAKNSSAAVVPVAATSVPEHASVLPSTIVTEHANANENANAIHYSVFTAGPKPKRLRTIK